MFLLFLLLSFFSPLAADSTSYLINRSLCLTQTRAHALSSLYNGAHEPCHIRTGAIGLGNRYAVEVGQLLLWPDTRTMRLVDEDFLSGQPPSSQEQSHLQGSGSFRYRSILHINPLLFCYSPSSFSLSSQPL